MGPTQTSKFISLKAGIQAICGGCLDDAIFKVGTLSFWMQGALVRAWVLCGVDTQKGERKDRAKSA